MTAHCHFLEQLQFLLHARVKRWLPSQCLVHRSPSTQRLSRSAPGLQESPLLLEDPLSLPASGLLHDSFKGECSSAFARTVWRGWHLFMLDAAIGSGPNISYGS